jgi:hypothetical protein
VTAWCVTLTVGKGAPIETIAEAARLAKDGDTIDILPGEYHADVAVWLQKRLTIRGVGETPVLKADGRSAEGKAIWVLRNGEFVIENGWVRIRCCADSAPHRRSSTGARSRPSRNSGCRSARRRSHRAMRGCPAHSRRPIRCADGRACSHTRKDVNAR